jgi:radical SAM superfamily enzyme YgiQ (UPF0313 family)
MESKMKNRILLVGINAKYIHSNPAIYSLRAYADKYYGNRPTGAVLDIVEYTINQSLDLIMADLYGRTPDVVAFSCYIWNWNLVRDITRELPKVLSGVEIWLGGPEVSYHADKIVDEFPQVSGVMVGEGEETFLELLRYYYEGAPLLSDIKGIVTKDGFTGDRCLTDINAIPFLYDSLDNFKNRIIYYESQRGCPFRCAYCLSSIDKKVRLRDIETVKRELKFFIDNKVSQVKFIDRTFNCNHEHALAIWRFVKENDNGVTNFHFEIAADLITEDELEVMSDMRPGLIQLEIGVQSTNPATLEAINRRMDLDKLKDVVRKIHGFINIHQHLDLIAGLPFEDYVSFEKSFDDVYNMKPNQLQLGFLKVLKGSPMEEVASEFGIIYNSKPPYEVLSTKWLSYGEVLRLKGVEEMVELYYNSNQFTHTLPVLACEFESPFKMFEALADYYREGGYFISTPARAYRYELLFDFACKYSGRDDRVELYRELLTFDMYLRENLKSRAGFMAGSDVDRDKLRRFFEGEEAEPLYLKNYKGYTSVQMLRMTHVERFYYPVWDSVSFSDMARLGEAEYVLFDYEKRDVLTHDARVQVIGL